MTSLKLPSLGRNGIRIVGYSDAAFANNYDLKSQLGSIILLTDNSGSAEPIAFKSYKSRRVACSVLSTEVIAFADTFDEALAIRAIIDHAYRRPITMHFLTDSKSLLRIISKDSCTSEKKIMLDIHAAREAYKAREISSIGFVRSSANLADRLTKLKMQKRLFDMLKKGTHIVQCEQWTLR